MRSSLLIIFFCVFIFQQSSCQQRSSLDKRDIKNQTQFDSIKRSDSIREFVKAEFPLKQRGWTNDFEKLFTKAQVSYLDSIISKFEVETEIEMVLVTIEPSFVSAKDFDNLVTSIGNTWGVGKQYFHNGIVIGLSKGLQMMRISTGKDILSKFPDRDAKLIIDSVAIPKFKEGKFYEGTLQSLQGIITKLK
jgi:uncharacterized membrane protein YgcG